MASTSPPLHPDYHILSHIKKEISKQNKDKYMHVLRGRKLTVKKRKTRREGRIKSTPEVCLLSEWSMLDNKEKRSNISIPLNHIVHKAK